MSSQAAIPSVLIVEDERLVAKDLQRSLKDMGYDPFAIAASADEAIACASAKRPDVVLMDIRIKGQADGISTAAVLKEKFQVIVIFLTAHSNTAILDRAKRTEPSGYLLKPVREDELRSAMEVALYKRELEHSRQILRACEQRSLSICDNVPMPIGYFDRSGQLQFGNRAFRATCALDSERQESDRQLELAYVPDADSSGSVIGTYALGFDVTQREMLITELHQARVDLETILDNVPASVTSWSKDLTNRFANRAAELEFRMRRDEMHGRHMEHVLGDRRFGALQPVIQSVLAGLRCTHDPINSSIDNASPFSRESYIPDLRDGTVVGFHVVSTDVTEPRDKEYRRTPPDRLPPGAER